MLRSFKRYTATYGRGGNKSSRVLSSRPTRCSGVKWTSIAFRLPYFRRQIIGTGSHSQAQEGEK